MNELRVMMRLELLEIRLSADGIVILYNMYNHAGPDGITKYNKDPLMMKLSKDVMMEHFMTDQQRKSLEKGKDPQKVYEDIEHYMENNVDLLTTKKAFENEAMKMLRTLLNENNPGAEDQRGGDSS